MQLADVGRNEPCPCGSGRKYKKCCLAAHDAAVAVDPAIVAAVDRAIEEDDWEPLEDRIDAAMALFEEGCPLEHVRFRHDQIRSREPDSAQLVKLCTAGWLGRCEREMVYVLENFALDGEARDGLRLAVYLLRRFGALSPTAEEIAKLQVAEQIECVRRLADAVSIEGLTMEEVMAVQADLVDWVQRNRPSVLSFGAWLALRAMPDEVVEELWCSIIAIRVCEVCLDVLEDGAVEDRQHWLAFAATTLIVHAPRIGRVLAHMTSPRQPTSDERVVYEALVEKKKGVELRGMLHEIQRSAVARGEYADAALVRAVIHSLQRDR